MRSNTSRGPGIIGKLVFSGFGLFFAVFGFQIAVKQEWGKLQETIAMQQWQQVPCTIVSSTAKDAGEDFQLMVSFRYEANGQTFIADRYGKYPHFTADSIIEVDQEQKKFPKGKVTHCHCNPANPTEAVLRRSSIKGANTSFLLTFIFPAFGLLFAILPWIGRRKKETEAKKEIKPAAAKKPLIAFGAVFALIGLAVSIPMFIIPLQKIAGAKSWDTIDATVVSSKVKSHDSDDGTTYSVYIAYRYKVDGVEYLGDKYTFMGGSSSGREGKTEIVRQYPEGHRFSVYVDPANPSESVINREFTSMMLLGLIPLVFSIVGIVIMVAAFRAKKAKLDNRQSQEQIVTLEGTSPVGKAVGLIIFTVIWNGVVFLIFKSDAPILFHIVFGFFGVVMILASIHAILTIFNPRPTVEITPGNIHPGTSVAMRWRMDGRTDRIGKLTISLQCLRITTETSGSGKNRSTRVVKTPLHETVLLETESQNEIAQGTLQFTVPEEQPPSEPGNDGGIRWQLLFHGDISRWPDLKEELPFTVYPEREV
ncbi:MAG: DUF3592 domain-containing protein [Verrucomicrobiota bacterium]